MSNFDYPAAGFGNEASGDILCHACAAEAAPQAVARYDDQGKLVTRIEGENWIAIPGSEAETYGGPKYCDQCHKLLPYMTVCIKYNRSWLENLGQTECRCDTCHPGLYAEGVSPQPRGPNQGPLGSWLCAVIVHPGHYVNRAG